MEINVTLIPQTPLNADLTRNLVREISSELSIARKTKGKRAQNARLLGINLLGFIAPVRRSLSSPVL
jgi:hypothetical protein